MLRVLFRESCESIDREYVRLGHTLGWRFVTGRKSTFAKRTEFLFISLNPGGDYDPPDHPRESSEGGSSYLIESWKGKPPGQESLQVQFQRLIAKLQEVCGDENNLEYFIDNMLLTAHFIPFRSPRFNSLHKKDESIKFARELWARIFRSISPRIMITLNPETFQHITEILSASEGKLIEHRTFQTGWGVGTNKSIGCEVNKYERASKTVSILRLPHLSTFKLFSRDSCEPYLNDVFTFLCSTDFEKR